MSLSCEKADDRVNEEMKFLQRKKEYVIEMPSHDHVVNDVVNHPLHYNSSQAKCECGRRIECIDLTRHMGFALGNALKYIWRADHKGSAITDIEKAIWYLQDELAKRKAIKNT